MIHRDPILDDNEILFLQLLYRHSPNHGSAQLSSELKNIIGEDTWNLAFPWLHNQHYIHVSHSGINQRAYISFKGKLLLYDIAAKQDAARNAFIAILISGIIGIGAILFSTLDYYGDLEWQKSQLKQLEKLNVNLEILIQKIEDPETSSGRQ